MNSQTPQTYAAKNRTFRSSLRAVTDTSWHNLVSPLKFIQNIVSIMMMMMMMTTITNL